MYGPERCCDASCLIASITRSQTATPPRSPSRREFLSSFGAFRHCLVAVAREHQVGYPGTALALFVPQLVFVPLMQGAMNRRTGARIQIIRQLSVSVVEATSGNDARDQTDDGRIDRVFELNMGIFRFKFTMNFLMNLSTQLQIIAALLVGGWLVHTDQLEIGGVVAFISGIGRFTDPWGDRQLLSGCEHRAGQIPPDE